jgi:hypothetical protein
MSVLTPASLALASKCFSCLTGQRAVEAVKAYLVAEIAGNNSTPNQLVALATAAVYINLSEKQLREAIVYLVCSESGGDCSPETLAQESVCYQCLSWNQLDGGQIYLLAQAAGNTGSIESITGSAINFGWRKPSIKELLAVQVYLLSIIATGSVMDRNLLAGTVKCFQCIGARQLRAMEVYALFFLNNTPPVGDEMGLENGGIMGLENGNIMGLES